MLDYTTIGQNIRILRLKRGITQATLAEALDVTPDFVSKIENASKRPSLKTIDSIAEILEVDICKILLGTDPTLPTYQIQELINIIEDWEPETRILLTKTAETFNDIDRQIKDSKKLI